MQAPKPGTGASAADCRPLSSPPRDLLALIGNTPLVRVSATDTGCCELFLKLESHNPGGSIKDRIGLSMISAAEQAGHLTPATATAPGSLLVEATAGNTGLALAMVAARKGYRLLLVLPDKMSQEKVSHLRALGADVRVTRSDVPKGHPEYYHAVAERLARELGGYYINQFANPHNPDAHEQTTAPEIHAQMGGAVDAIVCGVGSGGTITGISRYFAKVAPQVEIVLADPVGSILADYVESGKVGQAGSWLVEGVGEDFVPSICDLSRVQRAYAISDEESFSTARALLRDEGIFGGSSTGLLVAAALRYCRAQKSPKRVVTFVCDSGGKYLSKMFSDQWMRDQGFLRGQRHGDLRDLIARSPEQHSIVSVSPGDSLLVAYNRMRLYDVSQLPVLDGEQVVGIVDESDLLRQVHRDASAFHHSVASTMTRDLKILPSTASQEELQAVFQQDLVALVCHEGRFAGLITRIDWLNSLRRSLITDAAPVGAGPSIRRT